MEERRATYFCVDLESSGPAPGIHDLLSWGGVAVRPDPEGHLHLGERLYLEFQPVTGRVAPGTEAVHGLTTAYLREHGLPRALALRRVEDWVRRATVPGTEPVFVGHNAPFDWSFTAHAFAAEGRPNPFGYKALDTKALAMGVLGLHWLDTDKERILPLLGLPPEDLSRKHRADYDAELQARILVALLERLEERR